MLSILEKTKVQLKKQQEHVVCFLNVEFFILEISDRLVIKGNL